MASGCFLVGKSTEVLLKGMFLKNKDVITVASVFRILKVAHNKLVLVVFVFYYMYPITV